MSFLLQIAGFIIMLVIRCLRAKGAKLAALYYAKGQDYLGQGRRRNNHRQGSRLVP